jgi:hypothetical protein
VLLARKDDPIFAAGARRRWIAEKSKSTEFLTRIFHDVSKAANLKSKTAGDWVGLKDGFLSIPRG